jgi:hypothetical protein
MLRGCSLTLVLYATLAVGYFYWLRSVFPPPGVYIGAAVVGFLVLCCLGALSNARRALKDWSLASFARHGLPPRDGELIAVTGTIHPLGEPLIAPFSGEPCVVTEKRVGVGEQVCVIGVYHEMNRGLLPPAGSGKPNRLIRGSAEQVEQKSRSAFFRNLAGSLLALVVIHAGVYAVMQAYLHSLQNR